MTKDPTYKDESYISDILKELAHLSAEMNDAIRQKDLAKIEHIHLQKQELINKLNLFILAQKIAQSKKSA